MSEHPSISPITAVEDSALSDYFNPPRVMIASYLLASYEDDTVAPPVKSLLDWGMILVKGGMTADHSGDCTNECHACSRCIADRALAHADAILALSQPRVGAQSESRCDNCGRMFLPDDTVFASVNHGVRRTVHLKCEPAQKPGASVNFADAHRQVQQYEADNGEAFKDMSAHLWAAGASLEDADFIARMLALKGLYLFQTEPWKRCPSTHCERRGECSGPRDCTIKVPAPVQPSTASSGDALKPTDDDWQDDPSADERWNAGLDYGMIQLCSVLGVDPHMVTWDAATETLDGDVCAAIGNIFRTKYGDDFDPTASALISTEGDSHEG